MSRFPIVFFLIICYQVSFADYLSKSEFIDKMVDKYKFDKQYITNALNIKPNQKIIKLMNKPAERLEWHKYKAIFLEPKRINNGVNFWRKHKKVLQEAEKKYGVPAEIIVAIIGVETYYGKIQSNFSVLDALNTLSFSYPRRAEFFQKELEKFLVLTSENKLDMQKIKGSYAGAIGIPQFMPSSYLAYAVSYKGKFANLSNNFDDAIYSVAHYLKKHGWKKNEKIIVKTEANDISYSKLNVNSSAKPQHSIKVLANYGVKVNNVADRKLALIKFKEKDTDEYWLGMDNFYTITRYNSSNNYAMAVYLLGQEIKSLVNS